MKSSIVTLLLVAGFWAGASSFLVGCDKDPSSPEDTTPPNYYSIPNPPSETWLESSSDSSGNTGIIFHWKDNSNNEDGFDLFYFDSRFRSNQAWKVPENATSSNSLDHGFRYGSVSVGAARMRSFNRGGWSEWVECRFR